MSTNQERAAEMIATARVTAKVYRDGKDHISPHAAQALADAGLIAPDLPAPDETLDAMSADGTIGPMAVWGHYVDVEAMRNPRIRGQGAITVFGRQVRNPRELAHQILAAVDYIETVEEA